MANLLKGMQGMRSTTVREIPDSLWAAFRLTALQRNQTVNQAMIDAITRYTQAATAATNLTDMIDGSEDSKREERS